MIVHPIGGIALNDFITQFARQPDGSWLCLGHVEITTPMGRIQVSEGTRFHPGTIFMAVDIVQLLELEDSRVNWN